MAEDEARAKEEFKTQKEEGKRQRDHDKAWESSRDGRVGTWRDFMTTKSKKTKGGSAALGGLKPPSAKTNDEDKRYVQRAVGEQFRPAQPKRG
jgi:DnaJ family protein C protein 8